MSLTGEVGTVYSIQYATGLSSTNQWVDRTLLQAQGASNLWTDPSAPTPGQRFYRAVSVPAPADSNLVFIQPGTFMMGSPTNEAERAASETQHTVTISRGFWMGKYLVTQGDYFAVVGSNPSFFNGVAPNGTNYGTDLTRPVESLGWFDATNYCAMRTQQERAGATPSVSGLSWPKVSRERERSGGAVRSRRGGARDERSLPAEGQRSQHERGHRSSRPLETGERLSLSYPASACGIRRLPETCGPPDGYAMSTILAHTSNLYLRDWRGARGAVSLSGPSLCGIVFRKTLKL